MQQQIPFKSVTSYKCLMSCSIPVCSHNPCWKARSCHLKIVGVKLMRSWKKVNLTNKYRQNSASHSVRKIIKIFQANCRNKWTRWNFSTLVHLQYSCNITSLRNHLCFATSFAGSTDLFSQTLKFWLICNISLPQFMS